MMPRQRGRAKEPEAEIDSAVSATIARLEVLTDRLEATAGALEAILESMRRNSDDEPEVTV